MTNEEFEKRQEFIIEQPAQFAADIQQLRETQAQTEQMLNRLAAVTHEGFKAVNSKIDALVDSQIRLTKAQALTDGNLRNLIAMVDRYFSENHNHQPEE